MRLGRVRLVTFVALVGAIAGIVTQLGASRGGAPRSEKRHNHAARGATDARPLAGIPAVESGLEPWRLNGVLSRSVVLTSSNGRSLVVAGGLSAGGASSRGVYLLDPINGSARQIGELAAPVHDAAGFVLRGKGYVVGGGSLAPSTDVQRLGRIGPGPSLAATEPTVLAQPRADDSAVTVGSAAYVVGGYGSRSDADVLSSRDGRTFTVAARLPLAVRYAAVAAQGTKIFVFGGDAAYGPGAGAPVDTVQVVDTRTGRAWIGGHLPRPLAGAVAVRLGDAIYVAGGETSPLHGASPRETRTIYAWSTHAHAALVAGRLMVGVAHAGVAVLGSRAWLVGGEAPPGSPIPDVQMIEANRHFGVAGRPGAGSPYYGDTLLIADRGANRLLALDDSGRIIWRYPSVEHRGPPGGLYFPDDAFFTHHGHEIISNQEENDTLIQIAYPSGRVLWNYGHRRQPGSAPGYLNSPDDAYLLKNGDVTVADPMNCRVLVISPSKRILRQIGTPGSCLHRPPHFLGSPNGDTPLGNGNLLVSEINGSWIDEYTREGRLVWATHLPISYPSDPQPYGRGRFLVANYAKPGAFIVFTSAGRILYRYAPPSGPGELNFPSLVERLPSGVLMANDDYNDRIVTVDPATGALVWQYGRTGVSGTASGLLSIPDGFDLLGPKGTFPTHPVTG